ncbi:MAG TPA: hypothetical protein VHT97_04075, partial [Acidimicrobiales bacterium]|nr:hypothetical protein [Acidimicrobiales bacterium]
MTLVACDASADADADADADAVAGAAALAGALRTAGLSVSVCIPARDEAATIAGVVTPIVELLCGVHRLVREVIVADDGSV